MLNNLKALLVTTTSCMFSSFKVALTVALLGIAAVVLTSTVVPWVGYIVVNTANFKFVIALTLFVFIAMLFVNLREIVKRNDNGNSDHDRTGASSD